MEVNPESVVRIMQTLVPSLPPSFELPPLCTVHACTCTCACMYMYMCMHVHVHACAGGVKLIEHGVAWVRACQDAG